MKSPAGFAMALAVSILMVGVIACSGVDGASHGPDEPDMVEVSAPIESVEILVMESFPPQYSVVVVSGLPNSCVSFGGYSLARDGETIQVKVTNLEPADPRAICAQVYGTVETVIPLGSDFDPNATYTVDVNGTTKTFPAP